MIFIWRLNWCVAVMTGKREGNMDVKETLFVSFSGGRTSAYMSWYLINNWSHQYDFVFVYANTGLEHEGTLEFIDRCDKEWKLNLVWLEAKVNPIKGTPIEFSIVNFDTASREGEPFKALCAKHGIPNSGRPFCTQYLKTRVINAYKSSLGLKRSHKTAIGIRADEFDRMNNSQLETGAVIYPLIKLKHTIKADVLMFFKRNSFDLDIDENYGNCVTCFKKSERHLMTIAKHQPERFDFNDEMEHLYGHIDAKPDDPYRFFRGNKKASDIIASSSQSFVEFSQEVREFQMGLDIDPIDEMDDCGATCEAY